EYTAPQIQKESFFKTLSFGYQLGAGGGIKVTRQLRVGANIEYNQCFFSPKAISVDAGYLKPLNYSTSAFSMASVHGKIGLFYTLQDAARPFYSVRDHIITPPENKQKDRLLELQYDLTALASDSLNIKRIQYLVQDTASKTIYQKGFIKTRKAGKLRIGTPEGASLIIVKPPGFDLVTTLPAESLRNMLLIKIPNLMEHDSLTVIARALKPLTFYALYIGDGDSIKLFQDRSFRKICQSGSTAGSKWALIERYKNVFVPIDSAGACSSLEYIIRSDPEESGSFVEKLYKALHSIELFNRKVELIVLVNTKDAFIQYIVPAVRDFQEMSDVYENWKNVRIQVFTGFNLKELQGQIGIIERGWNIKQLR
ncbi:MAG: hypothetical protein NTV01_04255, partial [Bacteroidia bacterium]|nr:hypothetical protein [Bacteroidia bacterium]